MAYLYWFDEVLESLNMEAIRAAIQGNPLYLNGDHRNRTNVPLIYAAEIRNMDLCTLLLSLGADVNACDSRRMTALHAAAIAGSPEICELLLKHGADPTISDIFKHTPLMWATSAGPIPGRFEAAQQLLSHGGVLDLNSAVRLKNHTVVQEMLDADPHAIRNALLPKNLLVDAIVLDSIDIVRLLLERGVDPNESPDGEAAPIFHTVSRSHKDPVFLQTLLKYGASTQVKDSQGESLLDSAESVAANQLMRILAQHGCRR